MMETMSFQKVAMGFSRPSSQENVNVMLKTISKLQLQVKFF